MEGILLTLTCLVLAISFAFDKASDFIDKLKNSASDKLKNGFEANLSIVPIDKKSEDVSQAQPPQNDYIDKGS